MAKSKQLTYIIRTNWLHLLGFYLCVEAFMLFYAIRDFAEQRNWSHFIIKALLPALFLMFTHGLIVIVAFYISIIALDILCFKAFKMTALDMAITEWLIIAPIFIYWAIRYNYWLWIALVFSFLVTQFIRSKLIIKRQVNSSAD